MLPGLIERAELIGGRLWRFVASSVQPEHPVVVECEYPAFATGPEQLIKTDAERGQHGILPGTIKIIHRSLLAPPPRRRRPDQLAERQLRAIRTSSSWATALTRPFGVSKCTSANRSGAAADPARCEPIASWRAAPRRVPDSASHAR